MASSKATPASFAELWEQLGMAHTREMAELREENFRMRGGLAYTTQEYPWCGTFEDEKGRAITVGAIGDSIVVAFPAQRTQLAEGSINVLGIAGKCEDGVMVWGNGDRWRKLLDVSAEPVATEYSDDERTAGTNDGESRDGGVYSSSPRRDDNDGGVYEDISREQQLAGQSSLGHEVNERNTGRRREENKKTLPFLSGKELLRGGTFECSVYKALELLVRSSWFEAAVWVLVMLSAVVTAAELQYEGLKMASEIGYGDSVENPTRLDPGAVDVFHVLEWTFGIAFTVYLTLKISVLRGEFLRGSERLWNLSDLVIAVLWWIWQVDRTTRGEGVAEVEFNPQILRVFRLAKLLRHLKMARQLMTFDALRVMTTAMKGSLHVFLWAVLLLCLFQIILALVLTGTVQELYLAVETNDVVERRQVYKYFGTFTRTFLTMFEMTLANWIVPGRIMVENVSEWWTAFAVLHKLTIGFAMVGIINGVFMQETFKVASSDDKIMLRQKQAAQKMHAKKMKALFAHLDTSQDGKVDHTEFQQIVNDKKVRDWLSAQDLTVTDADSLFALIAGDDGEIDAEGLISGVARLKGSVRMLDFAVLAKRMSELFSLFQELAGSDMYERAAKIDKSPLSAVVHHVTDAQGRRAGRGALTQ